ncbi:hypothetical protein ILP92_10575 [Maribius pontilimi]|uniref:Flagellar motility protein MotE, a chaperone for MotC folding n=1 Tax=Palleronia pontilimi TaxID=1964209 RepID=A0A934MHC2_9RHOB|nr:hypothetical protein [Palleronia pontilimi]MBJ3763189.1 hypothetical protein [Palleronia pontilimi]
MARRAAAARLRRAGIGALPVLAGVLMASGLIRIGDGPAGSLLREFGAISAGAATAIEPADGSAPQDEVAIILAALKDREAQLDAREDRLAKREATLANIEQKVRAQMDELSAAEEDLTGLLKLAQSAADDDLTRLTTVYENMNPKEASAVFTEMSPIFAAGFLARMRPESAAAIMSGLDPKTAYSISVMIAGRNASLAQDG